MPARSAATAVTTESARIVNVTPRYHEGPAQRCPRGPVQRKAQPIAIISHIGRVYAALNTLPITLRRVSLIASVWQ